MAEELDFISSMKQRYSVDTCVGHNSLESVMNARADEGWELVTTLPEYTAGHLPMNCCTLVWTKYEFPEKEK